MHERGRKSTGELRDAAAQWQRRPTGRARLAHLAQQFHDELDQEGLGSASLQAVRETYGTDSAQSLMAEYVWHVDRLDADPVAFADRCGQLLAILRERHGIDPEANKKRLDLMNRGREFFLGSRKARKDRLASLIYEALSDSPNGTARQLLRKVKEIDGGKTIQEIDTEGTIIWRAGPLDERETSFKSFQNRLTEYRKKLSNA